MITAKEARDLITEYKEIKDSISESIEKYFMEKFKLYIPLNAREGKTKFSISFDVTGGAIKGELYNFYKKLPVVERLTIKTNAAENIKKKVEENGYKIMFKTTGNISGSLDKIVIEW